MIPHIRRRAPLLGARAVYEQDTEFHYTEHCRYASAARQQFVSPLDETAMPIVANLMLAAVDAAACSVVH
jgi:hypothetical protein